MQLTKFLLEAIKKGASDIHLTIGVEPIIRINGVLNKIGQEKITSEIMEKLIEQLLDQDKLDLLKDLGEVDFAFHLSDGEFDHRFRVNVFSQRNSFAAVLRIIPHRIPQIDELGLPMKLKDIALKPRGIFLVTGPTGSGKSTTLAAMIDLINGRLDRHIITLEDPIEYVHKHQKSIVNQRSIGDDTHNFSTGLRAALRQDPDIILVGEIRDLETMKTAITAAETGHLVLTTLHTNSAAETIERIVDVFPPYQQTQVRTQLSLTLQGVLSQQLLANVNGTGRVLATELLIANNAVRNLIREGKSHQISSVLQTSGSDGMHSMDYSLRDLYLQGKISRKDAISRASDINTLQSMI